ncbi:MULTISPECIES: hypothetical protein [Streptomyces]|uniref:hypothetical protein n=2 Tax=Streptomyces TaxID=1883 RepID=UPI0007019FB6|nr:MULTISPECIES: hypothetical protein [unclassified Streptomyces]KQX93031.1 hypothetical protein ASD26_21310 [Streptomyces sp. Root1319]KQZ17306.1 hypothetical protein ASD51_06260 [Streptomyces sp. Root55]MDX3064350.1 hypothetical protein [Streptomyces sp. ND04-05B]
MTLPTHRLTTAAEHLLTPPQGVTYTTAPGTRARAAAALLRLALDETMDTFWRDVSPAMTRATGRAKALCLERYATASVARQWYAVWSALSAACHHHIYELPPTPAEVRAWHQDVVELLAVLPSARR